MNIKVLVKKDGYTPVSTGWKKACR